MIRERAEAASKTVSRYVMELALADDPDRHPLVLTEEEQAELRDGVRELQAFVLALRRELPGGSGLSLLSAVSVLARDRAVKAERRVLASMRAGRGKGTALAGADAVEARLEPSRLTRDQREAVRTVLLSNDLVIGVQGHAGSGKTTMLSEVKELLGERKIQGLAPSAVAARVLAREAGIPTRTLQYFLTRFGDLSDPERLARARAEYGGAVLAVDEASMIGSVRMEALLRIAHELGVARVALVGDTKQLKAVDAGQPFRLLQKAGMATATMKEVKRQRDPELRAAVGLAREGEPGAAIAALGNRVREAPPEELGIAAGRRWLALAPEHRADTLILAPTHAICRQANDTVREGLAEEGALRGRTLAVERLVNRRLTRVQASDIRSYEPGDTIVFHRDVFGCRANDVCTIMGHDDGRVVLAHPDGERRFRPSGNAARYLGLYDTERIELRAGDLIRWTRNRKAAGAIRGRCAGLDVSVRDERLRPSRIHPATQCAHRRGGRGEVLVSCAAQLLHHRRRRGPMLPTSLTKRLASHAPSQDIRGSYGADWTMAQLHDVAQRIAHRINELLRVTGSESNAAPQTSYRSLAVPVESL